MREVIYLRVAQSGVRGMTKTMPRLDRGEIPDKLEITIDPTAFREPTIVRQVHVADWREGTQIADVELRQGVITEEEAEVIRQRRIAKMREVLEGHGYTITELPAEDEPAG